MCWGTLWSNACKHPKLKVMMQCSLVWGSWPSKRMRLSWVHFLGFLKTFVAIAWTTYGNYCFKTSNGFCFFPLLHGTLWFFLFHMSIFSFYLWCSLFFLGVLKNGNKTFCSQTHSEKQVKKHNIPRYPKYPLLTFIRSLFINCCVVLHIV